MHNGWDKQMHKNSLFNKLMKIDVWIDAD